MQKVKIWVDDIRPAPGDCFHEWIWTRSTNCAIEVLDLYLREGTEIEILDLDHDAGDWVGKGGDYIEILKWLERKQETIPALLIPPIRLHSMNPVGVENMRAIIERNGWKEIR